MYKYWPGALIALALFLGVIVLPIWSSDDFGYCVNHEGQYPAQHSENNNPATVGAINTKPTWVFGSCLSGFANENGTGITALATVLLTFVTGFLGYLAYLQFSTTRAELRAYVLMEGGGIYDGPTLPSAPIPVTSGCPNCTVGIKNFGSTPAFDVRHACELIVVPTANIRLIASMGDISNAVPNVIGPGAVTRMDRNLGRAITPFEISALASSGNAIIVYGKITYKDAFGTDRITEYRLGYAGVYPPAAGVLLQFVEGGNRAT